MALLSYQIFIVREIRSTETGFPIENSLTSINTNPNIVYLNEEKSKSNTGSAGDYKNTCIGIGCGRVGCNDCNSSHEMIPATPDYGIFEEVSKKRLDVSEGVIIIKTTSVTVSSADNINKALTSAETAMDGGFDIFFFTKWLDRADQYETLSVENNTTTGESYKLVRTWNAHGFQALAFSPTGFQKLLSKYPPDSNPVVCRPFSQVINNLLQTGSLVGITSTPSLMQYDATLVSTILDVKNAAMSGLPATHSYLKTAECRGNIVPEKPLNRRISTDISLYWFFIIAIIVTLTTWVILKLGHFDTLTPLGVKMSTSTRGGRCR